jgi:hypothetical protein
MEALVVKKFFDLLSKALSSEHPGSFSFSEDLRQALSSNVPEPSLGTRPHDISYLVYRLKQNALGIPDPIDGKVRNTPATLIPFACELLANRWGVIKDTPEDYTRCSVGKNKPSVTFVKQLVNFSLDSLECEPRLESSMRQWMRPFPIENNKIKPNIYALLIPTLTQTVDAISLDSIINSEFHSLILSQDQTSLLSLKNSDDWFKRGEGFFNIDQGAPQLFTELEKIRIKQKPRDFWPSAMLYTDYIVTKSYPGPALALTTKNTILNMLDRAEAVESDPNLSFAGFKQKYSIENKSLAPQDIEYLWDAHEAKYREEDRMKCKSRDPKSRNEAEEARVRDAEVERLKLDFRTNIDRSGKAQSDGALSFLALKTRQAEIATITAEMLVYCDVLKQENPDQHRHLMNQVLFDGKTQPKTFECLLKYVPDAIDCSAVALLSDLSKLFKPLRSVSSAKRPIAAVSPSPEASSAISAFFSFFSSSDEPRSVTDKMAYSPDDKMAYLSDRPSHL